MPILLFHYGGGGVWGIGWVMYHVHRLSHSMNTVRTFDDVHLISPFSNITCRSGSCLVCFPWPERDHSFLLRRTERPVRSREERIAEWGRCVQGRWRGGGETVQPCEERDFLSRGEWRLEEGWRGKEGEEVNPEEERQDGGGRLGSNSRAKVEEIEQVLKNLMYII